MYGWDILYGISKVPFDIPHKISYPYIEFLCNIKILKALRLKSSNLFLKLPPLSINYHCYSKAWYQTVDKPLPKPITTQFIILALSMMINSSEAEWCMYTPVQLTNIGWDNGLSPVRR